MPTHELSCRPSRKYKLWRYPGTPIPRRLQSTYSMDGKNPFAFRRRLGVAV